MIILRYDRTFFDANTYILADEQEKVALVVDVGAGSRYWIKETLAQLNLTLGAVLITHGHPDHFWDVSAIAEDKPVYIAQQDMYRFADPLKHLGMPEFALAFPRMGISEFKEPENLQPLPATIFSQAIELVPGIPIRGVPTPGHTEGSAVYLFTGQSQPINEFSTVVTGRVESFMLTGDVVFKGAVGRTDLPGGDDYKMAASLRFLVQSIKPETILLPGHGAHTTMFSETRNSPFFHKAMS